jgi:hypothetical protein
MHPKNVEICAIMTRNLLSNIYIYDDPLHILAVR